jgi:preprotein translocase subunit SecG
MSILIGIFTFVLLIVSALLILLVLAQKTKDGGMGAALGGGMTESTFGAETGNVLSKMTINLSIAFFLLSFLLYLGQIHVRKSSAPVTVSLPSIGAPAAAPAPATPAPADQGLKLPVAPAQDTKKP